MPKPEMSVPAWGRSWPHSSLTRATTALDWLALSRPCEIRHLGIFLNLELDPTSHWEDRTLEFDADNSDVLSFGREQECLVGTVDLVYRNSWNEIRTLHFNGPEAVVEALSTILGKMHQDALAPDAVAVRSSGRPELQADARAAGPARRTGRQRRHPVQLPQ